MSYNDIKTTTFPITDTILYVPVVTLSTQVQMNLDFLTDPIVQGVNRLLVSSFENENNTKVSTGYYLSKVELRDYSFIIDGNNFFDLPVKNNMKTYDNIQKIATGQGDDDTTDCLLAYNYFKSYYNKIAINLSKQQALNADPKAIQQINFTGNLDRAESAKMFFIIKEAKETILDFSQETVKILRMCSRNLFCFNIILI